MMSKPILKPIYFNPKNPKELEILAHFEGKFSSFGGIVKDLLYERMQIEKGLMTATYNSDKVAPIKHIDNDIEITESYDVNKYVDENMIEDMEC